MDTSRAPGLVSMVNLPARQSGFVPALDESGYFSSHQAAEPIIRFEAASLAYAVFPWHGAPPEIRVDIDHSSTAVAITPGQIEMVCRDWVAPELGRDYVSNRETLRGAALGLAATYASGRRRRSKAAKSARGQAIAAFIPNRCLALIRVDPLDEPDDEFTACLGLGAVRGGEGHSVNLAVPGSLTDLRALATDVVKVAARDRITHLSEFAEDEEARSFQSDLERLLLSPEPDIEGASLIYPIPGYFDLDDVL